MEGLEGERNGAVRICAARAGARCAGATRAPSRPNQRFAARMCCVLAAALAMPALAGDPSQRKDTEPPPSSGALATLEQFVAGLDPLLKGAASPVLATLIEDSREQAVAQGVEAIPAAVRAEIEDYVPAEILDRVRWCVACGGPFSLQHNTFLLGYAPAITLDYVVVFQRREDALGDPSLWVHELKHVMQYMEWGVEGFATRYVDDYEAVESEAAEYRWQWMKKTGYLERRRAKAAAERRRGRIG